jgi:hypothetical protein
MKKDWIPFELALELKQLGFDEPCLRFYLMYLPAPTFSQAFRWFRDNGKVAEIFSQLLPSNKYKWGFKIQGVEGVTDGFFTYEEAELACLKKLIDQAKEIDI